MSGKSKSTLTDNGVIALYKDLAKKDMKNAINLQVIFLASTELTCYIRVSDGKNVSPVTLLLRKNFNPIFGVGAVIAIKEVHIVLLKDRKVMQYALDDEGFPPLYIESYTLLKSHSSVGKVLGSVDVSTSYRDAISHVHHILRKIDPKIDSHIRWDSRKWKQLQTEGEIMREHGNRFFKQMEYNQAIAHYDIAKKKDPYDYRVWCNCSQAHFKLEEFAAAEQDALIAIKMNPFIEKAYYRAGHAALKQSSNTTAGIYAQNGLLMCGRSKDLQQLLEEASVLNLDDPRVTVKPLLSSNTLPALLNAVCKSSGNQLPPELLEKAKAVDKSSSPKDELRLLDALESQKKIKLSCNVIEDLDQYEKEVKRDVKEKKIKKLIKFAQEDSLREQEERRINEEKQKEKGAEQKKMEYAREEERNTKPKNAFHETLRKGRRSYEIGQFRQALESFSRSLIYCCPDGDSNTIKDGCNEVEVQVIQFVVGACKIQSGREYILEGMEIMKNFSDDSSNFPSKPAAHYWLGIGFEKIYLFKMSHHHAWVCGEALKTQKNIKALKWPGTDDSIPETVPDTMRSNSIALAGRAVSARPTPKAKCRFKNCISTQGHAYAKEEIYLNDPDFKGYLDVTCEECCNISYHPCCWKALKEQQEEGIGRMSDKDFLGLECMTPDCTGKICSIRIYDETGKLKNEVVKDKKEKRNVSSTFKQKKKKDKKKAQPTRNDVRDKKKAKSESISEDKPVTEELSTRSEVTTDQVKTNNNRTINSNKDRSSLPATSSLPIDPESLEITSVTILKPTTGEEEVPSTKLKNKNKKKNKKNKAASQPDLIGDPLDVAQSVPNEYLSRLRALRQQRDALEADLGTPQRAVSANTSSTISNDDILKWVDPNNPFYMPQHLRDNPQELECILQSKMKTTTSPDLSPESISILLDFMYDWLKSEGPMSVSDARLREQVSENFPPDARTYVKQCGGIKEFLMQSIKFAMIDDLICVGDHAVQAKEIICREIEDQMTNSRYLISDGQKAKKFTHLLDDTQSSCSSASSTSQLASSGISYASRGTSDSTLSASKMSNGEMNHLKVCRTSVETSANGIEELDSFEGMRGTLNPTAPEFKPKFNSQSDEEEEDDFLAEVACNDNANWPTSAVKKSGSEEVINMSHEEKERPDPEMISGNTAVVNDETDELFQSDEEVEDDNEVDEDPDDVDCEKYLKEEVAELKQELYREREHNQLLNDKLFQVKSHFKSEISKLKRQLEELKEGNLELDTEKQSLITQRETESRKYKSEMSRMQEEVKTFQSRNQSLEVKCEISNDRFNELQAKLTEEKEMNVQLREEMKNLQESLTSSSRRAHEAEVKYMCTKKDLVENLLNRTINQLSEEAQRMRCLLPHASEETVPDRVTVLRSIVAWDETTKSLGDQKRAFMEEATRLLGMVNQGRPLNALPPGDLSIPAVPLLSLAPLLNLGRKNTSKPSPSLNAPENNQEQVRHPSSSSPQIPLQVSAGVDPPSKGVPLAYPSSGLENTMFIQNGATAATFNSGAIPKVAVSQPSTTPEIPSSTKWPDTHQLFMGQHQWEYNEGETKPIIVGNHALNVQAKESKKSSKPTSLAVGSVTGAIADSGVGSSSSAYGLSDISLNASAEASMSAVHTLPTPTLHQPTTLTVTKPKFQNLTSTNSVGAIGTLPPKLVRPQPRQASNTAKIGNHAAGVKEDCVASTASYKRLIEVCKQRIGKDYSSPDICSALREVRIQNNNSLSGISTDKIVERVKHYLRSRRPGSGQATVAPWAGLTQGSGTNATGPEWQGPVNEEGVKEETCSICLEALNASPTVPLQCQHVFHEKCIKDWLKRQSNCPNCRKFALMTDEYPSLSHA